MEIDKTETGKNKLLATLLHSWWWLQAAFMLAFMGLLQVARSVGEVLLQFGIGLRVCVVRRRARAADARINLSSTITITTNAMTNIICYGNATWKRSGVELIWGFCVGVRHRVSDNSQPLPGNLSSWQGDGRRPFTGEIALSVLWCNGRHRQRTPPPKRASNNFSDYTKHQAPQFAHNGEATTQTTNHKYYIFS